PLVRNEGRELPGLVIAIGQVDLASPGGMRIGENLLRLNILPGRPVRREFRELRRRIRIGPPPDPERSHVRTEVRLQCTANVRLGYATVRILEFIEDAQ